MKINELYAEIPRWKNKVRTNPVTSCWEWLGYLDRQGYGVSSNVRVPNTQAVHRISYTLLVGTIPEGLTIDHECEVRHCINPEHLNPCTIIENIMAGAERRRLRLWQGPQATAAQLRRAKGICPSGHVLAEVGTLPRLKNGKRKDERCKACQHETQRKHREKAGIATGKVRGAYGDREKAPKSGYKGVSWVRAKSKWKVAVYFKGKNYYGGEYSPEDVHLAGQEAQEIREALESGGYTQS